MALSNWYNGNIVIDTEKMIEIDRNVDKYQMNDSLTFNIYKNRLSIHGDCNGEDIHLIVFDNEEQSQFHMKDWIIRTQAGSFPSEITYLLYNFEKNILVVGSCGVDNYCHNCEVTPIGSKIQDIYWILFNLRPVYKIIETEHIDNYDDLIRSITIYNQGGRKYGGLLTPEHIKMHNEYEDEKNV